MDIVSTFKKHFASNASINNDFLLIECDGGIMIGVDKTSHISVVIKSSNGNKFPIKHKTQNMSIECNVQVSYILNGNVEHGVVHIIRCISDSWHEKELFLELATVLIGDSDGTEEAIMDTFNTLRTFFSTKLEISDNELVGLYAELYTICKYHQDIHIEKFWQSRDRMKFDFSISEKLKLEIKSTTKNSRVHHFRHEQLMTELYNIYVLSYMFRYDDEGLSLWEILLESKNYLKNDPIRLLKINKILKNVSEERLKSLKFNRDYTERHMRFYEAINIPKFKESTPNGVSNAEYDCVLDNVSYVDDKNFINAVKQEMRGK